VLLIDNYISEQLVTGNFLEAGTVDVKNKGQSSLAASLESLTPDCKIFSRIVRAYLPVIIRWIFLSAAQTSYVVVVLTPMESEA
jgi:hypothetical protein